LISLLGGLVAQTGEDWLWGDQKQDEEEEVLNADFIKVNYERRNPRVAMLMSALVPGAGQFYADKKAITAYIFPAIEIGLIAGLLVFQKQGDDKTKDFERFANQELITFQLGDGSTIEIYRYDRTRQHRVEAILRDLNPVDIYEPSYFRLDDHNCQHFYEDIGKYSHYVFGWADWYYTFATDSYGNDMDPSWLPVVTAEQGWIWSGNNPLWGDTEAHVANSSHASSPMRKTYVDMRNKAKKEYAKSEIFKFGLAFNHIGAALDAIRVTRKVNRGAITDSGLRMQYYTTIRDQYITPTLAVNWKF
jgi:hypothetical protein